jgi:hypothetical protein
MVQMANLRESNILAFNNMRASVASAVPAA